MVLPLSSFATSFADSLSQVFHTHMRMQTNTHLNMAYDLLDYSQTTMPDSCMAWAPALKEKYLALGDALSAFCCDYQKARGFHHKGKFMQAQKEFRTLKSIALTSRNDSLTAMAQSGLGSSLLHLGQYSEALDAQLAALKSRTQIRDFKGMAASYNHIASVYAAMNQQLRALENIDKGLAILRQHPHAPTLIGLLHSKANMLGRMGRYEEALQLDNLGLQLSKETKHLLGESQFYNNMALCYMHMGQYVNAELYFYKCLEIDQLIGNPKQIGDSYTCLGELFQLKEENDRAIDYFRMAYDLSETAGYLLGLKVNAEYLANTFKDSNMPDSAFGMLVLANKWKDSIANEKVQSRMEELIVLYETEQKEKTIAQQQIQLTNARQTLITLGALALIAALGIFSWERRRLYRSRIQKEIEQKEQHEQTSRAIVTAEEEERRRIGLDIHDSIGQLLSASRMNLISLSKSNDIKTNREHIEKSIQLLDKATEEVRHIAHGMVPYYIYDKGFESVLQHLSDNARHAHLRIKTFSDPLPPLDNYALLLIYRILQEAIQNAIKHSGCTEINITANHMDRELSILVEDNGKGFLLSETKEGLGLKNMRDRVRFLGGELEIGSKPFEGTTLHLNIPLQKISRTPDL